MQGVHHGQLSNTLNHLVSQNVVSDTKEERCREDSSIILPWSKYFQNTSLQPFSLAAMARRITPIEVQEWVVSLTHTSIKYIVYTFHWRLENSKLQINIVIVTVHGCILIICVCIQQFAMPMCERCRKWFIQFGLTKSRCFFGMIWTICTII